MNTETLTLDTLPARIEAIRADAAIGDWERVEWAQRKLYAAALRAIAAGAPGAAEFARAALEAEIRPTSRRPGRA